jgi:hypothetical protein
LLFSELQKVLNFFIQVRNIKDDVVALTRMQADQSQLINYFAVMSLQDASVHVELKRVVPVIGVR